MIKKFQSLSYWKKIIVIAVGFIIIGIFFFFFSGNKSQLTARVTRATIAETVAISGNILSNGQTPMFSSTTGIITALYVTNGESVVEGQMIASIKSTASETEKKKAYADYTSALNKKNNEVTNKTVLQSQLETGRQTVINAAEAVNKMEDNRNNGRKNPATGKDYTQNEIDSLYSALTAARQSFTALEKNYTNADSSISSSGNSVSAFYSAYQATQDSVLYSPINGQIANIAYSTGDKVTASAIEQGAQTTPLMLIIGYSRPTIKALLNEANIAQVIPGQLAKVTLDAVKDKTYDARVERLDSVGTNTEGVITYNVYLTLETDDPVIRPGMTANVTITTQTRERALLVPNSALNQKDTGIFVTVKDANRTREVPVKIGIKSSQKSEVVSGLSENDEVIVSQLN